MHSVVADMIRIQREYMDNATRHERQNVEPNVVHAVGKRSTKIELMRDFMDDRNYTDEPTQESGLYDAAYIRETMIKESPEEYVGTDMLGPRGIGSVEINAKDPYSVFKNKQGE